MMKFRATLWLSFLLFVAPVITVQAQTTLSEKTANNTSACSDGWIYCQAGYVGMSDSTSGTYNAVPGKISLEDMHEMEYSGANTAIYVHFMPWFCMQPGSTSTGVGTTCNGHYQVGYNSNDSATVNAQMDDMQARGIGGPIIDWYGPTKAIEEGTTQKVKADLESRCSGGTCPMQFAITEDQGSISKSCPQNGGGTDQTSCITKALENDLDYMNATYFPSPAYLRVDASTMRPQAGARPAVFFFICESCFTNPSPNWTTIFQQLRQHVMSYTTGDPLIWFIFRNAGAFTHVESDGGFAWVNHYGSNDTYGLAYLDNFYDTSLRYPTQQTWGAAWKGFDNTNAPWKPSVSITPQQCGNTWVQTFAEMTRNNDYSASRQLPFMQLVTWNDYDEGTEIETGIDNCMSLAASTDGTNLSWSPNFAAASGNENTVHHYDIYESPDGSILNKVATVPVGTHAIPLSSINLGSGAHTLYVEAVGKPSILNKLSAGVPYTPNAQVTVSGISPNSGTTLGGTAVTITGMNFQTEAAVTIGGAPAAVTAMSATSISAVTPAHAAGAVDVTVTNPDGTAATLASGFTYVAPASPSFVLSASPTSRTVGKGNTANYNISVSPKNGYTGRVNFSVSGLPSGSTASFSPTYVTTSGTTKLAVATTFSVKGTFTLTVNGANSTGTLSSTVKVTLVVK